MRKFMDSAIGGVAVVVLATGLVGCRSTTSHLASVPGFGWLDRGDEGWANYEPSPELPKPSATAEPTFDGPAANIASSDKPQSPFDKPISSVAKNDSKSRFDTDRYLPKNKTVDSNSKPSFGSYASAYGKYAPPKFGNQAESGEKSLAAQDGPYSVDSKSDTPKFADSTPSKDFTTNSQAPTFGPALDEQFSANERKPEFTASSNSRFGAPTFDNKPATTSSQPSYTPPGFPTTPKVDAVSNRFDNAVKNTLDSGQQSFNRFAGDAAKTAQEVTNTGAQPFNRFSNNPPSSTFNNAMNATNGGFTGGSPNFNNNIQPPNNTSTAESARQAIGNMANAAQSTATNTYNNAVAGAQNMANEYRNAATAAATNAVNDVKNRFGNVSAAQTQALTNAVQNTNNNLTNGAQNFAQGAAQNINNRFGGGSTSTPSLTGAVQNATQNIAQGAASQVQNYAQGTVNALEQGVVSKYEQAKSTATNYANNAINTATQQANNLLNSATSGTQPVAEATQNALNNAGNRFQQATNAVNNVMQNVSNNQPKAPVQYPSTSTPNPFLKPATAAPQTPNLSSPNPSPTNGAPATNSAPATQRSPAPFLPGSTKNFQSSVTVRKQAVKLASAGTSVREPLLLAVGDKYQFPLELR